MHNINFSISKSNTYIDDYTTMGYHQFTNPFNGSLGSYIVMSGMTTLFIYKTYNNCNNCNTNIFIYTMWTR